MKVVSLNMRGWGSSAKRRRLNLFLQSVDWCFGGMLTIWNTDLFVFKYSFTGDGFLGICVDWNGSVLYIINVYAPCTLSGKRKLWDDLLNFKSSNEEGEWCLGGDFNAILKIGERKGSSSLIRQNERWEFRQFVEGMEVVDVPVTGKKFTWFSADRKAMSRLDRFLLSEGFIDKAGVSGQWVGDRDISDHCPIWLSLNIEGKKAFVLKEKLTKLKEALKGWNREVFRVLDLNIEKPVKELNEVESMLASDDVMADFVDRGGIQKNFWDQLHYKESLLKQKSRMRWVKYGDTNSRYIHASLKGRRRRNQMVTIKKGDEWLQGVDCIKNEVKQHFEKNFSEEWLNRPFLSGIDFNVLNNEDNSLLLEPFGEEEVREVIWSSDGNKSPGPDGFNFNFLKACWTMIKHGVMAFLQEFHQTKLKRVLSKLISNCQSAFLPKRQIMDGVLVLNEIIDLAKRRKDECLIFKVDFERTYDTVSWKYLEKMMIKMGFAEGWLRWMKASIFESSMSVLVNGSPTEDFKVSKGLRQGDPPSPFLFLIAAEGLTGLVKRAVDIGKFHGYNVHETLQFQILQFADDIVLVGEGSWYNVWTIKTILRGFELVSSIKINFVKSKLYGINMDEHFLEAASNFLLCRAESIPFKILGLPVGANPRRLNTWKPVIESMTKRLSSWNGRHLSIGGDGNSIGFWKEKWIGEDPLRKLFPNLFAKELDKNVVIAKRIVGNSHDRVWNWCWCMELSASDLEDLMHLQQLLFVVMLKVNGANSWRWIPDRNGVFLVDSTYTLLQMSREMMDLNANVLTTLQWL
ncbi:hypothetical protein TSUD_403530 [Trifolium subterraneum]|uniref:Uncharacterized protein n=1 Tax=Trifolium subterraneum TaxID=3900 RepID=A0A2Z6PCX3_TRISU|nr:hypothetical protein TSUD_403530 [Trifolium subterraneum]